MAFDPTAAPWGSMVSVVGEGWEPGETVLAHLLEVESHTTEMGG